MSSMVVAGCDWSREFLIAVREKTVAESTVRFYVPEWDDHVDADYDFVHDEHSALSPDDRDLQYIWDIFDHETTPIDGVLLSREKVEESPTKFDRLTTHGVYHPDSGLHLPDWLPTISDCGAWGYKALPFPPYGNADMLEFYEQLGVTTGVTIDHLVLGSGEDSRLYLDERAFSDEFTPDDIPEKVTDAVNLMIEPWPDEWPEYVSNYAPEIVRVEPPAPFHESLFDGNLDAVLERLDADSRAVYRDDDSRFRYDLTLRNAAEMAELYEDGNWPFRLMVAIQGWDPQSYARATADVLEMGYQYIGIGGVAGSSVENVRTVVSAVGSVIHDFEEANETRVDHHVFGFAKQRAFDTIGRSGVTSFDSASMLRAAWMGKKNYHLNQDRRFDAVRVRFPKPGDDLETAIAKSLRAQEVLYGLRAFDRGDSIAEAISQWETSAERALETVPDYVEEHRWDDQYSESLLVDLERNFRSGFEHAGELKASFGDKFRGKIIKLLRADDPNDPVAFTEYLELVEKAHRVYDDVLPNASKRIRGIEREAGEVGTVEQAQTLVEEYAEWIGDEALADGFLETIEARPWEECDCPLCSEFGIEVAIFRANNRNRRRGFHNTRRFYDQFEQELPKFLVATPIEASASSADSIESHLRHNREEFWRAVHDLPVAEIGVLGASGVHEWWAEPPSSVSLDPDRMAESLGEDCTRYQSVFVYTPNQSLPDSVTSQLDQNDCTIRQFSKVRKLRSAVLDRLGYVDDFIPEWFEQSALGEFQPMRILVLDQCSATKSYPDGSPTFSLDDLENRSREDLLSEDGVAATKARNLYNGRQQTRIDAAVDALREAGHEVDRYFVSAGFGLVEESDFLPPYNVTFHDFSDDEIQERAENLGLREAVSNLLKSNPTYDMAFLALGNDYYKAIGFPDVLDSPSETTTIVFNGKDAIKPGSDVLSLPARTDEARELGVTVLELKGKYLQNFARNLIERGPFHSKMGIRDSCLNNWTRQTEFTDHG